MRTPIALLVAGVLAGCASQAPGPVAGGLNPGALFILRQTSKTPDQVVDAVRNYAEANKWVYMGMNRVKPPQGEVTMVKVCIPAVGAIMWPLGLQTSAMLPCGNLGVYQKGGATEISLLDPRYMSVLMPHPEVQRASAMATPLLTQMLDSVAK